MARLRLLHRYDGRKLEWLHDSLLFIVLVVISFVVLRYVIGFALVSGNSMEPTLGNHECVLYLRVNPTYRRGDVVSMRVPSGDHYVKRIIAVGGDEVDLRDGVVYVNGAPVDDPWGYGPTLEETGAVIYPYCVRENNVFVLGDNREASMDSRAFGEVGLRQIEGKVVFRMGLWFAGPLENAEAG